MGACHALALKPGAETSAEATGEKVQRGKNPAVKAHQPEPGGIPGSDARTEVQEHPKTGTRVRLVSFFVQTSQTADFFGEFFVVRRPNRCTAIGDAPMYGEGYGQRNNQTEEH
jgi:hypothetical protein